MTEPHAPVPRRTGPRVGEQRPGGRSARVRAAVLDATIAELASTSYEELRIEDVAARAGVNKTTVYRRWPTKGELVAEAVRARSAESISVPDTGTFDGDLVEMARSVARHLGSEPGGRMTRNMIIAAGSSAEIAEGMPAFWAERLSITRAVVDQAVARGDVAPDVDANLIIETLIGAFYVRLLLTGEPITLDVADAVARIVHAGAIAAP